MSRIGHLGRMASSSTCSWSTAATPPADPDQVRALHSRAHSSDVASATEVSGKLQSGKNVVEPLKDRTFLSHPLRILVPWNDSSPSSSATRAGGSTSGLARSAGEES